MKNILITGANRGLGFALAEQFSQVGFKLLLVVRSVESKQALLSKYPLADVLVCDVTDDHYELSLVNWLENRALDVVINNAGSGVIPPK
ncbi:SDR family NAD(P)-dependent oxidoreductase, partial [Vibrio breoganii]|uniref:SDR family NAD(P)-dependent oxidoreductase n=1 Tax=Vibrio breoganii TaxID=553239 RepID=UPI0010BD90A2